MLTFVVSELPRNRCARFYGRPVCYRQASFCTVSTKGRDAVMGTTTKKSVEAEPVTPVKATAAEHGSHAGVADSVAAVTAALCLDPWGQQYCATP